MEKIWTVNRDGCLIRSRKGGECAAAAFPMREFQVKQDAEIHLSASRPGGRHGRTSTAVPRARRSQRADTGRCASVEPGLLDPQNRVGSSFSDVFTVESTARSLQMS